MATSLPAGVATVGSPVRLLYPYTVTDSVLNYSSVAEADHSEWSAGTTYAVGARVIRAATHRIYERVLAGASATAPESDLTNWLDIAPTNRWAMFDSSVGTSTSAVGSVTVNLSLGVVSDLVLLGVTGSSVSITKPGGGVVSASVPAEVIPGEGSVVALSGIGGTAGVYAVTVTGSGTVKVGMLAAGSFLSIGSVRVGAGLGVTDYSRKELDSFGRVSLVKRGYSKRLSIPLVLPTSSLDQVVRILTAVRSSPCIWSGVSSRPSTMVYGYPKEWSLKLGRAVVEGSLSIESLVLGVAA